MKSRGGKNTIISVAFLALLVVGSGAQASSLLALDGNPALAERQIGLFQKALEWLSGAWTNLNVAFGADEAPAPPSSTCTDPGGCSAENGDSGWTIDPEG